MRFLSASVKGIFTSLVPFWVFTPLLSCASNCANALACLDFCANVAIVNNFVVPTGIEPVTHGFKILLFFCLVEEAGFQPTTPDFSGQCSSRLSYPSLNSLPLYVLLNSYNFL